MAYIQTPFNTGIDTKLQMVDSKGRTYSFSTTSTTLISFDAKPKHAQITRKSISNQGREDVQTERYGWTGTIVLSRSGSDIEDLEYLQETMFRGSQDPLKFTLHQQIRNRDGSGSSSNWRYESADVRLVESGNYALGQEVNLTLNFDATDRVKE